MSSFLQLSEFGWGNIEKTLEVDVVTLDDFALRNNIEHVDVLKSDTQGFDAEVLKGSSRLFSENRVSMVLLEIIFSDMYKEGAKFDQVLRMLTDQGFLLVDFYDPGYQEGVLSWSDALFVHSKCHARLLRHTT